MTTITNNQESSENEARLLSSEERTILSQIATKEAPDSQRAQALLAIDEGATQAEAGHQAGLTKGQVRYWLGKFRKDGTSIFPEELLNQTQPEDADSPQSSPDAEETAGPVDEATAQQEDEPEAKKKPKKKSKKTKKTKKVKKPKQAKKKKKKKKSKKKTKKKKSKKAKGKSSKKGKKKPKK
jgi:hypothetical protein